MTTVIRIRGKEVASTPETFTPAPGRHRGERRDAEGNADPDPDPLALPAHRPYPAKAGRAWTKSSRSKNVGGRATPGVASSRGRALEAH